MGVTGMLASTAAAASPTLFGGSVSLGQMAQFGLLGLIFVCLVLKKFVIPEWTLTSAKEAHASEMKLKDEQIEALKSDKAELKQSLEKLQQLTQSEILPALVRANQLAGEQLLTMNNSRGRDVQP